MATEPLLAQNEWHPSRCNNTFRKGYISHTPNIKTCLIVGMYMNDLYSISSSMFSFRKYHLRF